MKKYYISNPIVTYCKFQFIQVFTKEKPLLKKNGIG